MNQQLRDWAKQALEMLEDNHHLVADNEKHRYVMMHLDVIKRGKALLEQPAPVQEHELALYEATQIATFLWKNFYKDTAPQWEVLPDIRGVLSQIDNMVAGLKYDPPAQPADHSEQHLNMVDHDVEKAVAYLNGVHTGKQIAKREWVGLTDDEMQSLWNMYAHMELMRAIDAKLREKNGGVG
jgi:hypothetical protein